MHCMTYVQPSNMAKLSTNTKKIISANRVPLHVQRSFLMLVSSKQSRQTSIRQHVWQRLGSAALMIHFQSSMIAICMKDTMAPHVLGDGSKTEGWIWSIGPLGKISDTEHGDWTKESEWYNWLCVLKLNALFQLTVCNGSVPSQYVVLAGRIGNSWGGILPDCTHLTRWNLCGMSWLVCIQNRGMLLMPMRSQLCIETWLRTAEEGSRRWEVLGREQGQV